MNEKKRNSSLNKYIIIIITKVYIAWFNAAYNYIIIQTGYNNGQKVASLAHTHHYIHSFKYLYLWKVYLHTIIFDGGGHFEFFTFWINKLLKVFVGRSDVTSLDRKLCCFRPLYLMPPQWSFTGFGLNQRTSIYLDTYIKDSK